MAKQHTIHSLIEEQTGLATTYAKDGAFRTAAQVLRRLANAIEAHAEDCDRELVEHMRDKR